MASLAEAALDYAHAGRVVFPVRDKTPLVRFGELEPGAWHARQVRYWWHQWPTADIGLRTGDGLVVIDIDPRHGGRMDESWPVTRTEQTPSGGVHLFYRTTEHVPNSAGRIAAGVDVRGHHGFVVAAPSPGYALIVDAPIVQLPPLPERALRASVNGELPPGWQPFEPCDHVPKGYQHDYLMRYGGWLWHYSDLNEDELEAAMWDEAARVCAEPPDPTDHDEVQRMRARVAWIVRREQ